MDENQLKIRINLTSKELDVEGNAKDIVPIFEKYLKLLSNVSKCADSNDFDKQTKGAFSSGKDLPDTFGEYHHLFQDKLTSADSMLIAGHYISQQENKDSFTTSEASKLLKEQGIAPSNPADAVRKLKNKKMVIMIKKGVFRVSPTGKTRLSEISKTS